jgi:diguanylate cyclase
MATLTNPAEIARETLKQMTTRRMAPSPDNYRAIYNEIAGIVEKPEEAFPERELKSLLSLLPKETPAQQGLVRKLDQALKNQDWESYRTPLISFIREHSSESNLAWGELIADFLQQWEIKQNGLTQAKKRESLDRVLSANSKSSALLFERLQNLVRSWSMNEEDVEDIELAGTTQESPAPVAVNDALVPTPAFASTSAPISTLTSDAPVSHASELLSELRETFVFTLEHLVVTLLEDESVAAAQIEAFATTVRNASTPEAISALLADIKSFAFSLEFIVEDRAELRAGLLKLLQLMIENISELVIDDHWLSGQIEVVRKTVDGPMNPRVINDAAQRLKDVILKQSQLKHSLVETKDALKQLFTVFLDHLVDFADSTSDYHDKIEQCVEKISQADDIEQLDSVLDEVIRETRAIQINAQRSRDELRATNQHIAESEQRISELQNELDKASHLVRHDQLTGVFNRRGLDEIYENEVARAQRRQRTLCVALLDIDNFKKLNDSLGHDVGDAALIHLVSVIRETLRPQDTLSRFGGEEFIILLPDTPLEDARRALVRVQRELTKRYFLNNNEKLLITFSAGVTEVRPDDTEATAIKRADEATYMAKKAGKNQVVAV